MLNLREYCTLLAGLPMIAMIIGCTNPVKITTRLEQPIAKSAVVSIGEIADKLPASMPSNQRPPTEDVAEFRRLLAKELVKWRIFSAAGDSGQYLVRGEIRSYMKGSGAARFLIGFGAGTAQVVIYLELVDASTGNVIFAGEFLDRVTSGYESGFEMFKREARGFARQLQKQVKMMPKPKHKGND